MLLHSEAGDCFGCGGDVNSRPIYLVSGMTELGTDNLTDLLVTAVRDLRIGDTESKRVEAARRLGSARSPLAVSYLVEGLSDSSSDVRRASVEALGEIGHASAIAPLRSLLEKETSPLVESKTILDAIARIRSGAPATHANGFAGSARPSAVAPPLQGKTHVESSDLSLPESFEKAFDATAAGLRAEETRQRLEETYRRAAAQRQMIEKARRQSIDEANRRIEQDRLRLEAEEESLTKAKAELEQRRVQIEQARTLAEEDERRIKEIQEQTKSKETARRVLEQESLRLQAEIHELLEAERTRVAELHAQLAAQQQRNEEHERALQRAEELRTEAEAKHRAEEARLDTERQKLDSAREQVVNLRAQVEAARIAAEDEIAKLKQSADRIALEEEMRAEAEQERLALEAEIRVLGNEERQRLEEMR